MAQNSFICFNLIELLLIWKILNKLWTFLLEKYNWTKFNKKKIFNENASISRTIRRSDFIQNLIVVEKCVDLGDYMTVKTHSKHYRNVRKCCTPTTSTFSSKYCSFWTQKLHFLHFLPFFTFYILQKLKNWQRYSIGMTLLTY
jgi:hypothetical protein